MQMAVSSVRLRVLQTTICSARSRQVHLSANRSRLRPQILETVLPISRKYWWSSSQSTGQTAVAQIEADPAPVVPLADTSPQTLDLPAKVDIPPLQFGDLSELGLISWTPAGLIRWSLEVMQVTTGMPWFHTIVATTLFFRVLLLPFSISSIRNSARLLPVTPRLLAIQKELAAARESRDLLAMQRVALKQKKIYSDAGVSMGPMMLNPFIQLPVTLGLFFGVKKMCTLPVEQLKQSGIDILPDLTVPDPYFILPIVATALINFQISVGSREMNLVGRPEVGHVMNALRAFSILGIYFMGTLPSGLMVSLVTGVAAISLQTIVLQAKPIRRILNIPDVPRNMQGRLPTFGESIQFARKWFQEKKMEAINTNANLKRR